MAHEGSRATDARASSRAAAKSRDAWCAAARLVRSAAEVGSRPMALV